MSGLNYISYLQAALESAGYEKRKFSRDNNSKLRALKIKSELGLEGRIACLYFDLDGNLFIYEPPKKD